MSDTDSRLAEIFDDHWQATMQNDPIFATMCGDHRYDDQMPSMTLTSINDWCTRLLGFRKRLEQISLSDLDESGLLNFRIFSRLLDMEITEIGFKYHLLPISRTAGFHLYLPDLSTFVSFKGVKEYQDYISRLNQIRRYSEEHIELMRAGIRSNYLPPVVALDGIESSIEPHIVADPQESAFYLPFKNFPDAIDPEDREDLSRQALEAIKDSVVPGYQQLLLFIKDEYRPAARPGISASDLPDGRAFYEHRIRYFTSLDLTAEQVHATGLAEVNRIRQEMLAVIKQSGFKGDMQAYLQYLRTEPRFYAETPEQLLKETALILKRIDGELPRLFNTLPRLSYGIRPIPDFSAPGNTTAYYMPGSGDGTRAGYYYVNTYDLKSRPFYEIEALSHHEAVPGHHLQIALQQELTGLPEFRRFNGFTSFVEGWALYAERLGMEMGFYQDPASDFGRLSYEMWRACRLVVDTGMHALAWSRQQAIDFMLENTSSTELNIINEVDRYISWPGQALAYKIGELKIRELRRYAEEQLGDRFDLRIFHDVILLAGAVPLDVLEDCVRDWVARTS
ncbi:MAG TPA: DUF885 domain-containing protein [Anaerolineales bacterium]|nr:DUF885 domain-containing protein [Anaerolineales bacterium]